MRSMRGQSTVEFAVGAASLVLLLLGTLVLSGFQEAQRRAIMASRQAAFINVWQGGAPDAAFATRLHRAHFDDAGYVRPVGDGHWIRPDDVTSTFPQRALPGVIASAGEALLRPLAASSGLLGSTFDLQVGGYRTGEVTVRLRPEPGLPQPFTALDLSVGHSTSLLGDAWNAADSPHVRSRTAGLVPAAPLANFSAHWRALAGPLSILEPNLDQLCLGLIEPEQVPEDRLGPRVGRTPQGPCR